MVQDDVLREFGHSLHDRLRRGEGDINLAGKTPKKSSSLTGCCFGYEPNFCRAVDFHCFKRYTFNTTSDSTHDQQKILARVIRFGRFIRETE